MHGLFWAHAFVIQSTSNSRACVARTAAWGEWRKEYYHQEIRKITAPVLLIAGEHEHLIGFDADAIAEDAKRLQHAEPPLILEGFSHFLFFEEHNGKKGHDLAMAAIDEFHAKHQM